MPQLRYAPSLGQAWAISTPQGRWPTPAARACTAAVAKGPRCNRHDGWASRWATRPWTFLMGKEAIKHRRRAALRIVARRAPPPIPYFPDKLAMLDVISYFWACLNPEADKTAKFRAESRPSPRVFDTCAWPRRGSWTWRWRHSIGESRIASRTCHRLRQSAPNQHSISMRCMVFSLWPRPTPASTYPRVWDSPSRIFCSIWKVSMLPRKTCIPRVSPLAEPGNRTTQARRRGNLLSNTLISKDKT